MGAVGGPGPTAAPIGAADTSSFAGPPWAAKPSRIRAAYDSYMSSSNSVCSSSVVPSARVVSFEDARHLVEQQAAGVCPGETETVDLLAGLGRVLAEGILADRDFPPFARATRDGYAVRAADLAEVPARLDVVGEVKAGDWPEPGMCSVGPGQAVGIMTGAPLPAGADAVVMVEHASLLADQPARSPASKLVEV